MTKRIPERGTPRYRTYWSERRLLDDLRALEHHLAAMATRPHVYGDPEQYKVARGLLMQAVETFESAWRAGEA